MKTKIGIFLGFLSLFGSVYAEQVEVTNINPMISVGRYVDGPSYSIINNTKTKEKEYVFSPYPGLYFKYNKEKTEEAKQPETIAPKVVSAPVTASDAEKKSPEATVDQAAQQGSNVGGGIQIKKEETKPKYLYTSDISGWNNTTTNQYEQQGMERLAKKYSEFLYGK